MKAFGLPLLARGREFDIGWRPSSVPSNVSWARRLAGLELQEHGLCCLVLDEASKTVKVQATLELLEMKRFMT